MLGWLCLVLCWFQVHSTTAPSIAPTGAPTPLNKSFAIPRLPISKAGAAYPDCRAELIFVLDVSGSVAKANQQTMLRFVVKFMIAIEQNVKAARFAVVIFGIAGRVQAKQYDGTELGQNITLIPPPYGNNNVTSSEVAFGLDFLRYGCVECLKAGKPNWSQLEMMYTLIYDGSLTPTWDGLDYAREEYTKKGDASVPGRFIVLITDGIPNDVDGKCNAPLATADMTYCGPSLAKTLKAVNATKNGTLLLTVGMNLDVSTTPLLISWASDPKDILSIPSTDYSELGSLIGKLLPYLCPAGVGINCLPEDATALDITGVGFLNTTDFFCRFFRDNESPTPAHTTRGLFRNQTLITCLIPKENWFAGEWNLEYTFNGAGYYKGPRFKTGTLCRPELLVIWWPFCALALLPLAFCRAKKVAPVTTQKVSRGVARAAPAATEEYEEYEEVEEIVAPPEPVNKWKVAPTAYIGFGRARMSVDWAGVAPESAPHEGVRKKVVKKVVSDHAPVPTAGPAAVPSPAESPPTETHTVHHSSPIVEEPDWVNSFMDRIAAIFCCCCVGKKK